MQKVSKAYAESMKDSLRERGYIMISFGVVNQEAQANARVESGDFAHFSNEKNLFGGLDDLTVYATLEENFTRVDGSMFFLPRQGSPASYYDTGLVSANLVSDGIVEVTIDLHITATDFRGITINFGENYPVDFDFVTDKGQTVEFRGNDKAVFNTEEVLEQVTKLTLVIRKMKNPHSRLRIYSFRFGYGLVYHNDSVMASTLESYVSPIGADIPQIDFSVTLKNYDKYFNVDNPKSAINFLETGQEMDIYYGYQLPDSEEIEWIRGNHLWCSEWESDDYTATIRCQDVFRSMDSEYYKGLYRESGKSYFDLAVEVLRDAGQTKYYIDPRLKHLYSKNPIPRVQHKQALQIIANACRCVLTQTREGTIQIKSNFVPEAEASCNGETPYSNIANIIRTGTKDEYATLGTDYTTADGKMFFLPRTTDKMTLNTGFVSSSISDADGKFQTNPVITLVQEAQCLYHGVKMVFGNTLPSGIVIRTYNNGDLVDDYTVTEEIEKTLVVLHDFDDFDTMEVEFTGTAKPHNRIVLNYFTFGDITNFTMERTDMTSSPKAIKQELVKEVIVPCYSYQLNPVEETLVSEEVSVLAGEVQTFFVGEPSYGFRATLDDSAANVEIISWGNYYITVKFKVGGNYRLEVLGHRYKIIERYAKKVLNLRGKTVKWENPLMSDMTMAQDLADWLGDYYKSGIEYEYTTRGNPEIDANDVVYQENEFHTGMKVTIYRETLHFNQSFSGKVITRRTTL